MITDELIRENEELKLLVESLRKEVQDEKNRRLKAEEALDEVESILKL